MELVPMIAGGVAVVGLLMMIVAAIMLIAGRGKKGSPRVQPQAQGGARPAARPPGRPPAPPARGAQPSPPPPPQAVAPPPPAPVAPPPPMAVVAPPPPPPVAAPPAAPEGSTVLVDPSDYAMATVAQARPGYYGKLVGVKGILEGREVPIDESGFFIGRDHTLAQLVVSDPRVSKKHCWVGVRGGEVWAVDQSSTNGTYVNEIDAGRITERRLNRGDIVIISEDVSRFEFRLE